MSDNMISESAERLFATTPAAPSEDDWSAGLWAAVAEAGYPLALLDEDDGGFGLDANEVLPIAGIAARHAAPIPLAETMVANWLLAKAGLPVVEAGPAAILYAPGAGIPWGRNLSVLVHARPADDGLDIARIDAGGLNWSRRQNIAGEPRDRLPGDLPAGDTVRVALDPGLPRALMAMMRVQQIAGAMDAVLAMSVRYATERVQFGRAIGKFQVIQQYLAVMAGEAAAASAAATMAAGAFALAQDDPRKFGLLAGAAKLRAGEAAGKVAELAHQVHGAIGFSQEYDLHRLTRRLWSWRDDDGRETDWARLLGQSLPAGPDTRLWSQVTELQGEFY